MLTLAHYFLTQSATDNYQTVISALKKQNIWNVFIQQNPLNSCRNIQNPKHRKIVALLNWCSSTCNHLRVGRWLQVKLWWQKL